MLNLALSLCLGCAGFSVEFVFGWCCCVVYCCLTLGGLSVINSVVVVCYCVVLFGVFICLICLVLCDWLWCGFMIWYDSDFVAFALRGLMRVDLSLRRLVICSYWLDLRLLVGSWCWCCVWCF